MKKFFTSKSVHAWHVITWVSCLSMAAFSGILTLVGPVADESNFLSYYVRLAIGPVTETALLALNILIVGVMVYAAFFFIFSAFFSDRDPREFFSKAFIKKFIRIFLRETQEIFFIVVPAIFTLFFISMAAPYFNQVNATRLIDIEVLQWDRIVTGTYPFIAWQGFQYPAWFIEAVSFSFGYLPAFLIALALYIFFSDKKLFAELAAAFSLNIVIMALLWQIFPVLSPHDRFIDNVYKLPVPSYVEEGLTQNNYHRDSNIQKFLDSMRQSKNDSLNGTMPTTTLPSAHVAWATIMVYYAYRSRKLLLIPLLPIAILSSIGTFLFAQHYFVDMPAGILVMILSIWLVRKVA